MVHGDGALLVGAWWPSGFRPAFTEPQRRRWINLLLDAYTELGLPPTPNLPKG